MGKNKNKNKNKKPQDAAAAATDAKPTEEVKVEQPAQTFTPAEKP